MNSYLLSFHYCTSLWIWLKQVSKLNSPCAHIFFCEAYEYTWSYLKRNLEQICIHSDVERGQKVFPTWHLISDQPSIKELARSVVTGPWVARTFCRLSSEKIPSIHPLEKRRFTRTHPTFLLFLRKHNLLLFGKRKEIVITNITRSCAERCCEWSVLLYFIIYSII